MSAMPERDALLTDLFEGLSLTRAVLSKPRDRSLPAKVTVEPVELRNELVFQFSAQLADRVTHENLAPDEARERLGLLLADYGQGLLQTPEADWQVLGEKVLRRPPTRKAAGRNHDRRKQYLLDEGTPVPFLVELGVMTPHGTVRRSRYDKFRQVNRFLELVEDVLPALPAEGTLRVVDFGSGKSYLTFALHHLLREAHGRHVQIVGLDLRADVVATCNALAERLGTEGLEFALGDIAGYEATEPPHLVVSLHACDTATDDALARAVRWEAPVILAVPCCQHELAGQIASDDLRPLLGHGLLRERFAADVTDAARAQLLRLAGYDVSVVELVAVEHTPKNVLLRAVRNPRRDRRRAAQEYVAFKRALGIDPHLERALADRIELAG